MMLRTVSPRAHLLLLLPCLLLTQCHVARQLPDRAKLAFVKAKYRAETFGKKPKKQKKPEKADGQGEGGKPAGPENGLHGLMNNGQALAGASGAGGAGAGAAAGGAAGEGGVFDFSNVVQTQVQGFGRVGWHSSLTTATQDARRTGKPILILFTHQGSSAAQALENTLVLTPDFRTLVTEQFIPLRINYGDADTRQSPYYRDFKSKLEAKGYPTVVITLPDGTEIERIAGYNEKSAGEGSAYTKAYLKRLEIAVADSKKAVDARRQKMESQRYRMWTSKDGSKVFARLDTLDANMATFTTEWGEPFKTFLTRLSEEDQAQIAARRGEG
ncbi:thioredoxin family protein [Roseimicrobium sp. ORNL1]|uniref:thioredoxin family protein n=1 Tax=Roseimicrobium sp. ORNL1 TaxID=2711231 RepID=UPI0013E1905F|nr:thioredoxin family protein [Roseimicrobium sp. ORNL1]QIF05544.1 thioredoxin family protein [Roseimicrobium sp. ORNL1]